MDLGTTKQDVNDIITFTPIIKTLREVRRYRHRVLSSFHKVHELFYPTVREDDAGGLRASWNSVRVPTDSKHLLTPLIELDRSLKEDLASKRNLNEFVRSQLEPSLAFYCLIFDRDEQDLRIDLASYKYSVVKAILDLQVKEDPDDPNRLLHGPAFCWDAIIEHKKDEGQGGSSMFKHKYTVEPYVKTNKVAGKIPIAALRASSFWEYFTEKNIGIEKLFTKDEVELINKCEIKLKDSSRAMDDNELREELKKFPINAYAMRNGNPIFADPKQLFESLNKLELPPVSEESMKQLTEGAPTEVVADDILGEGTPTDDITFDEEPKEQDAETIVTEEADNAERPLFPEDEEIV